MGSTSDVLMGYVQGNGKAANRAKAILNLNEEWTYRSPVFNPDLEERNERAFDKTEGSGSSKGFLQIFPNPAKNYVTVDFVVYEDGELRLRLIDEQGRVVYGSQALVNKSDMLLVPLDVARGVYLIELYNEKETLVTQKVTVE